MRFPAGRGFGRVGGSSATPRWPFPVGVAAALWTTSVALSSCEPYDFEAEPRVPIVPHPRAQAPLRSSIVVAGQAPTYLPATYRAALECPLPKRVGAASPVARVLPGFEENTDPEGRLATYQPSGPTNVAASAFFQPLGTNGRACVTCHVPADAMSVRVDDIRRRFARTAGADPIFAPVDGANCPDAVGPERTAQALVGGRIGRGESDDESAHSLLLTRGLFRIFLPVPADAQYTIRIVHDPNGCNTNPEYAEKRDPRTGKLTRVVSVYRRPRPTANLKFVTALRVRADVPESRDPESSPGESNLMWDGREPDLRSQAIDATLTHAQAVSSPTDAQLADIVAFSRGIYSAQIFSTHAHSLTDLGALGGPDFLATVAPPSKLGEPTFSLFDAWEHLAPEADRRSERESVFRGQRIFDSRQFAISSVAGLNDASGGKATLANGTCSTCHNQGAAGTDAFPGAQLDVGVGGDSPDFGGPPPSRELPIFRVVCKRSNDFGFHGASVDTNDPGKALVTGKCADVGRFTVAPLRGLAGRAPYFSDGSAATLADVVDFYDRRFSIGLSSEDKKDLVRFLGSL